MIRRLREGPAADARAEQRSATAPQHEQRQHASQRSASWWSILCPFLLLLSLGASLWAYPTTLTLDEDEILSAAIAGVSKVAELIATVPAEERTGLWKSSGKELPRNRAQSGLPRRRRSTVGFCSDVAIANRRRQLQAADADFTADFAELTDLELRCRS